ncbi:hypothetical protein RB600_009146 [Gaeumannomyces tritici]
MNSTYSYTPLSSSRHTRVLFLEPSPDIVAPLCCRISEISLDTLPENGSASYNALSYSWDAQSPSSEVLCDGGVLLVTPNCEAAMRRLRNDSGTTELWIDSICINQNAEAVEERNDQVALMGEIYKRASKMTIWLGDDDTKFRPLIERLRPILQRIHSFSDSYRLADTERMKNWDNVGLAKLILQEFKLNGVLTGPLRAFLHKNLPEVGADKCNIGTHRPGDNPFAALFESSWFTRMWVVQEATMSPILRTTVLCGKTAIPWVSIYYFSTAIHHSKEWAVDWEWWTGAMLLQRALMEAKSNISTAVGSSRNGEDTTPYGMSFMLGCAREKQSSDPKDKIFALVGVFQEIGMALPAPDYKKPLATVYTEATAACIAHDKNLRVLYHVPSHQRRKDLPSWVPDWSTSGYGGYGAEQGLRFPKCYYFPSAGGAGPSHWRFSSIASPSLSARGKIVGSISELGRRLLVGNPEAFEAGGLPSTHEERMSMMSQFYRRCCHGMLVFQDWLKLAQKPSCTATRQLDQPAREARRKALRQTLFLEDPNLLDNYGTQNAYDRWCDILSTSIWSSGIKAVMKKPVLHCNVLAMLKNMHRRLFLTQGGLMGTAHESGLVTLKLGDKIVVIDGLEVPFLLRPLTGGGYKVVTHAYVHGIMHGESYGEGAQESEEIELV